VDPDSLNPDPDPAFKVNPIRIQGCFDDQKLKEKKNTAEFNIYL
jgi:hypothetical protein